MSKRSYNQAANGDDDSVTTPGNETTRGDSVSDEPPPRKRRKQANFVGDPDAIYLQNEVVWARMEDFPWWPARIEWLTHDGKDPTFPWRVRVRWYGEDWETPAELTRDRVTRFDIKLQSRLQKEASVEPEDMDEYTQCVHDAKKNAKEFWAKNEGARQVEYFSNQYTRRKEYK